VWIAGQGEEGVDCGFALFCTLLRVGVCGFALALVMEYNFGTREFLGPGGECRSKTGGWLCQLGIVFCILLHLLLKGRRAAIFVQ
jgi:hypothetical protein